MATIVKQMTSQVAAILNFLIFIEFPNFFIEFLYFKMTRKQHLAIEIHKTVKIYCEIFSIQ